MRILYDHQIFDLQQFGGISRYFSELMRSYSMAGTPSFELACPYTTNAYLWEAPFLKLNTPVTRKCYKGSGLLNNILAGRRNRPAAEKALRAGDYDLFHPTYYDPYFLPLLGGKPFVLTVHDMIHERYPDEYPVSDQTISRKQLLVAQAAHIIAVSQSTKRDLIDFCQVPEERVSVVYHGCSLASMAMADSTVALPEKYLLYVGERSRYKNFAFAIRAMAPLFREQPGLQLLCVGGGVFTPEERALLAELGLTGRCRQMCLADAGLVAAYSHAVALIFPSLCEGFGIPVLEAFTCGCPAILNKRTSLPEVGGDAALYFDPECGDELLSQVVRLLADNTLRAELVQAGRQRVRDFSWERAASETSAVYARALGGKR